MAREREFTCSDCPPGLTHTTTATGPLPSRCSEHKRTRRAKTNRDGKDRRRRESAKSRLRVVGPGPEPATPAAGVPVEPLESAEGSAAPGSVLKALRGDLEGVFSQHPAAATLTSVAEVLADVLDSPMVQADGRIAAAVSKELRGVVRELVDAKAADDDDLFSSSAGPSVVGG